MNVKTHLDKLMGHDDYEKAMEYLAQSETEHAPSFDFDKVSKEFSDWIHAANLDGNVELPDGLATFPQRTWDVPDGTARELVAEGSLNAERYINRYLRKANAKLADDGYLVCFFDTAKKHKAMIFVKYPLFWAKIVYFFDFVWHRACPKLLLTRRFYYFCTKGVRRVIPRPEMLGRLCYSGFDVVWEQYVNDHYVVIGQKKRPPCPDKHSYGLFIKLRRVGKNGKPFNVIKLRTMFGYSEFLQSYVYKNNDLDKGGKFRDDYRVTEWGRVMRKLWIDEVPMFVNVLKGQMKLVGVRPLSVQYFNLYDPAIQQLRVKTKPGMLPPYYLDMPETLEEIQASEKRYLDAYLKHPLRTDWNYFWAIFRNIVFKGKRSK